MTNSFVSIITWTLVVAGSQGGVVVDDVRPPSVQRVTEQPPRAELRGQTRLKIFKTCKKYYNDQKHSRLTCGCTGPGRVRVLAGDTELLTSVARVRVSASRDHVARVRVSESPDTSVSPLPPYSLLSGAGGGAGAGHSCRNLPYQLQLGAEESNNLQRQI